MYDYFFPSFKKYLLEKEGAKTDLRLLLNILFTPGLKIPKMSNVKSYHKLPFCVIILIEHIVALWYDTIIISHEYLECMRTCSCFKTK